MPAVELDRIDPEAFGRRGPLPGWVRRVIVAAQDVCICLTLLPVFSSHAGFGGTAPTATQRRFVSSIDSFALLVAALARDANAQDVTLGVVAHRRIDGFRLPLLASLRFMPGQASMAARKTSLSTGCSAATRSHEPASRNARPDGGSDQSTASTIVRAYASAPASGSLMGRSIAVTRWPRRSRSGRISSQIQAPA